MPFGAVLYTMKTMTLIEYLSELNSADSQQGIWVDPANTDDYIIRPIMFGYNRQSYGDRVLIGSLDKLSFGFQSRFDAIKQYLNDNEIRHDIARINKDGLSVMVSISGIMDNLDNLDEDFRAFLDQEAEAIEKGWSEDEAELFVIDQLPEILQAAKEDN